MLKGLCVIYRIKFGIALRKLSGTAQLRTLKGTLVLRIFPNQLRCAKWWNNCSKFTILV